MKCAVLIPVGPGKAEIDRLADTLASLFHHEPAVSHVVLVDDAWPARELETLNPCPDGCRMVSVVNPRKGRGDGWSGGLTVGIQAGLRWIALHADCDIVLKLDTDALVIGPFVERIGRDFREHAGACMLGYVSADRCVAPALRKLQRPLTVWRRTFSPRPRLQCLLFRQDRHRRRLIRDAVRNGYPLGSYCQGGAYALQAGALASMLRRGALDHPLLWVWTPCGEDVVSTLSVYASGGKAVSLEGPGQAIRTWHRSLPDTPDRLVAQNAAVIHSVKNQEGATEADIRSYFRARRKARAGDR